MKSAGRIRKREGAKLSEAAKEREQRNGLLRSNDRTSATSNKVS
jgi:hypothetical protein